MARKNNWIFIVVGLIVILVLLMVMACGGKQCPLMPFGGKTKIDFQTLQGGVHFKTPAGADVTLSVVSSAAMKVKCVKQDGQDTVVRLSLAKK